MQGVLERERKEIIKGVQRCFFKNRFLCAMNNYTLQLYITVIEKDMTRFYLDSA